MTTENFIPDLKQENSLTSPEDRIRENKWTPSSDKPILSTDETAEAMRELNDDVAVRNFDTVERSYFDPHISNQHIGLISFTPAKNATPNANGVYGFAKLRGNFTTAAEANQRAEFIIREVDSCHKIYHTLVGRPFPITCSSKYSAKTEEIDIRTEIDEALRQKKRSDKKKESQIIKEIKEREKELLEDTRKDPADTDPFDTYITLKVKKAQLSWTYLEHLKKIEEIKPIIEKTHKDIIEFDKLHPKFQLDYYDRYIEARNEAGLKTSRNTEHDNFMKFMVEDASLPGINFDEVKIDTNGDEECDGEECDGEFEQKGSA